MYIRCRPATWLAEMIQGGGSTSSDVFVIISSSWLPALMTSLLASSWSPMVPPSIALCVCIGRWYAHRWHITHVDKEHLFSQLRTAEAKIKIYAGMRVINVACFMLNSGRQHAYAMRVVGQSSHCVLPQLSVVACGSTAVCEQNNPSKSTALRVGPHQP